MCLLDLPLSVVLILGCMPEKYPPSTLIPPLALHSPAPMTLPLATFPDHPMAPTEFTPSFSATVYLVPVPVNDKVTCCVIYWLAHLLPLLVSGSANGTGPCSSLQPGPQHGTRTQGMVRKHLHV